jgi:hypothetical protein
MDGEARKQCQPFIEEIRDANKQESKDATEK